MDGTRYVIPWQRRSLEFVVAACLDCLFGREELCCAGIGPEVEKKISAVRNICICTAEGSAADPLRRELDTLGSRGSVDQQNAWLLHAFRCLVFPF